MRGRLTRILLPGITPFVAIILLFSPSALLIGAGSKPNSMTMPSELGAEPIQSGIALKHANQGRAAWLVTLQVDPLNDLEINLTTVDRIIRHGDERLRTPITYMVGVADQDKLFGVGGFTGSGWQLETLWVTVDGQHVAGGPITVQPPGIGDNGGAGRSWQRFSLPGYGPTLQIVVAGDTDESVNYLNATWTHGVQDVEARALGAEHIVAWTRHDFPRGTVASVGFSAAVALSLEGSVESDGGLIGWFMPGTAGSRVLDTSCSAPDDPDSCYAGPGVEVPDLFGREPGAWHFAVEQEVAAASDYYAHYVYVVKLPPLDDT